MQNDRDTVLHPAIVRITHWTWALGVLILIGSGLRIYESDPVFESVAFPVWITLGGSYEDTNKLHNDFGLAAALLWHFAAMWLLFAGLVTFVIYGFVSGHFRRKYVPITVQEVTSNVADFLKGGVTAGLVYYTTIKLQQDIIDGIPGFITRGKNKVFALGPEVSIAIASKNTLYGFVKVNYQWELYARTAPQGSEVTVLATFPMKPLKLPTP